jgi:DNA repair exonuclease SbcCD ATPase subunit
MRISKLSVQNIGRISNFTMSPDGKSVTIKAPNGSGKTTILNSIALALSQKVGKEIMPEMVKQGEKEGVIKMEFDNGLIVERTVRSDNTTKKLTIKNSDGTTMTQTDLDRMWNMISFKLETEIDYDILVKAANIDLLPVQTEIASLIQKRRDAKAVRDNAEAVFKSKVVPADDCPTEIIPMSEVLKIQQEKNEFEKKNFEIIQAWEKNTESLKHEYNEAERGIIDKSNEINAIKEQIEKLQESLKNTEVTFSKVMSQKVLKETLYLEALKAKPVLPEWTGATDIDAEASRIEENNRLVKMYKEHTEAKTELDNKNFAVRQSEAMVTAAVTKMSKMIADADYGMDGLSINPDTKQVLFNGLPFGSRSKAEGLMVGLEWLAKRNPEMKFATTCQIEDFLDDENFEKFHARANELGIQIINEQVRSIDPSAIVITEQE